MSSAEKQYEHLILMSTCLFNEMKVPFTAIFREKVKEETIKGGPSTSKKITRNTMKIMKNAFHFILKAFFVLKIFKFLSLLSGYLEKTT